MKVCRERIPAGAIASEMSRNAQEPGDFPRGPVVKALCSQYRGAGSVLQYRGGEPRPHMPCGIAKKLKITKKKLLQDKRGWKLRGKGKKDGPWK